MAREAPTVEDGRAETEGHDADVVGPARTAERTNEEDTDRSMTAGGDGVVESRSMYRRLDRFWIGFDFGFGARRCR